MSLASMREHASTRLLRAGTELAIDQREMEERIAAADRDARYSSAHGAIAMARWVDAALLWLAWRLQPRTLNRHI